MQVRCSCGSAGSGGGVDIAEVGDMQSTVLKNVRFFIYSEAAVAFVARIHKI